MKKIFIKNIYVLLFILFTSLIYTKVAFASSVLLDFSKDTVGIEEQFYLDLSIDPQGTSINGMEGTLKFDNEKISLVRVEDGKSIVGMWIEKPYLVNNNFIKFSGIIPNGFDGVLDPFNLSQKRPGLIARFVFQGLKHGVTSVQVEPIDVTLNDGLGTITKTEYKDKNLTIQNVVNSFIYKDTNESNPELDYQIIKDPNIMGGKYVLLFKASDKETGIESVLIKEGRKDWKKIESPYLLKDQLRHSKITLQANNFSGSSIAVNIDAVPYNWSYMIKTFISVIVIILFIIFRKYVYK